jgi:hypothetical protein
MALSVIHAQKQSPATGPFNNRGTERRARFIYDDLLMVIWLRAERRPVREREEQTTKRANARFQPLRRPVGYQGIIRSS